MKCMHCGEDRLMPAMTDDGRPVWRCVSCGRDSVQGPLRQTVGQATSSSSDALSSLLNPFQLGQQAAQDLTQQAQQAYQDQIQRSADLLKQQQAQASGAATQAGSQAQSAGLAIALTVGALALVLYLTRT